MTTPHKSTFKSIYEYTISFSKKDGYYQKKLDEYYGENMMQYHQDMFSMGSVGHSTYMIII